MNDATTETARPAHTPPPIRDYTLTARIGEGATGEVWLANDIMGSWRAVKVVKSFGTPDDLAVLERELNGLRGIQALGMGHPNLCAIYHVGTTDDQRVYYVMELADNANNGSDQYVADTLLYRIKHKLIAAPAALDITIQLAHALDHLHKNKLIHRDIKPANIVFVKGLPKIADIGLVRELTTEMSSIAGTPAYMPPEFTTTASSDVYALAKVLYEMVTGLSVRRFPEIPTPHLEGVDAPLYREINDIVAKACAPDPSERFTSAVEFASALQLVRSQPGGYTVAVVKRRVWRYLLMAAAIVAVLTTVIAGVWLWGRYGVGEPTGSASEPAIRPSSKSAPPPVATAPTPPAPVIPSTVVSTPAPTPTTPIPTPPVDHRGAPAVPVESGAQRTDMAMGELIFSDDFKAAKLDPALWCWQQTNKFSYQGTGKQAYQVTPKDGAVLIEATAEHERGWSSVEMVWVESLADLSKLGDVLIYVELDGAARNGRVTVRMADGSSPEDLADSKAVTLFEAEGGNYDPLDLSRKRLRIEISGSSRLALVSSEDQPKEGFRIADLSTLKVWKLRFYVAANSSAGFRPGYARMKVYSAQAARIPEQTGAIGHVRDAITGRPVGGAAIRNANGKLLAHSNENGSFAFLQPSGTITLTSEKEAYKASAPLTVAVRPGQRSVADLAIDRTQFGFGDVISATPFPVGQEISAFAVKGRDLYYAVNESAGGRIYRSALDGKNPVPVAQTEGLLGVKFGGEKLYATSHWPGRLYAIENGVGRLIKRLDINWPKDLAYDGKRLWYIENSDIENRYGLYAFDPASQQVVARLPSQDKKISGLAWDGERFWVSSGSGRVYEITPGMALNEGSLEAGMGREFKGNYTRLDYADGYLWGLDSEMKRICKINVKGAK